MFTFLTDAGITNCKMHYVTESWSKLLNDTKTKMNPSLREGEGALHDPSLLKLKLAELRCSVQACWFIVTSAERPTTDG